MQTLFFAVRPGRIRRARLALVPMDEREDAAARAAGGDAPQALGRGVAEIHREIGDDQEMIFLRDAAGLLVVFGDGRVFVAQIHLDDLFHVLVQLGELFLDLVALRPDAAVDEAVLVIGEVHEAGEVLAEADRVEDGEAELARRRGGEQPENDVVDRADNCRRPADSAVSNRSEPCSGNESASGIDTRVEPARPVADSWERLPGRSARSNSSRANLIAG